MKEKIERPHFAVCKDTDHGHFTIPSIPGMSLPVYCKEHVLVILRQLIEEGFIESTYRVAILKDINDCNN